MSLAKYPQGRPTPEEWRLQANPVHGHIIQWNVTPAELGL